jgi:copper(I)-binding protein
MVIEGGARTDRVVGASSPRAAMVHLHTVEDQGGVARMRPLEAIEVPPGQRVELAPKGTHLMLMGLDGPLVAGQSFPVTLRFAEAGERTVSVLVKPATADDDHSQQKHH